MNFQYLSNFLEGLLKLGVPGIDCVVQKGQEQIFRYYGGFADREMGKPMSGKERFYLYSATKLITCTAALQLYEQGKILLSDPISRYLPEFGRMQIERVNEVGEKVLTPAKKLITVAHLFSMTAGFRYDLSIPSVEALRKRTKGRMPTREVIQALAENPLYYEPGEHWYYSLAHDVLGALVEVVSGERFGAYLERHIFAPLEMKSTYFAKPGQGDSGLMAQYRWNQEAGRAERIPTENEFIFGMDYESGGAGLISCTEDYARFAAMLACGGTGANGARILAPATVELMRTNQLSERQIKDIDFEDLQGYGYGLGVRTLLDRAAAGAGSPPGEFGWSGAAGSYVLIDRDQKISMFYMQHMRESMALEIQPRLRNVLYACL